MVTQLVGGKGKGRSNTRSQGIAPGLAFNVRVKSQNGQRRKERLLVFIVTAPRDHIDGYAQLFHLRDSLFQRFRVGSSYLDQCVHIVEILTLTVHHILQVKAGADGAVQFLIVLAGIAHIPHTGSVDHGGL